MRIFFLLFLLTSFSSSLPPPPLLFLLALLLVLHLYLVLYRFLRCFFSCSNPIIEELATFCLSLSVNLYLSLALNFYGTNKRELREPAYSHFRRSVSLSVCVSISVCLCLSLSISACHCLSLSTEPVEGRPPLRFFSSAQL